MRAAAIVEYQAPLRVMEVEDPVPSPTGAVLEVGATGICRSDWHAWMGHDTLPGLPHVPGHEMAGTIRAVGEDVTRWSPGQRVTVPFSMGCGTCGSCRRGHLNTCDTPLTPGFSRWGSFAELVAVEHVDINLVALPESIDIVDAAALGCRFVTSFHALLDRGRLQEGEWLAVHGCGGVGLSAVMIAKAVGARVVAVDIAPEALALAASLGADEVIDGSSADVTHTIGEITGDGADVSIDALGHPATALDSIACLRKHGRHVQVGLLLAEHAALSIPMDPVIMGEKEILGSRGMSAEDYPRVFELIDSKDIDLSRLVTQTVTLDGASPILEKMGDNAGVGVTVIDQT